MGTMNDIEGGCTLSFGREAVAQCVHNAKLNIVSDETFRKF